MKAVEGRPTQKRPEKTKNHAYAGLPPIWPAAVSSGGSEVFVRSVGLKVEDSFSPTTATVGGRRPTSCHKTNPPDSERASEGAISEGAPSFPSSHSLHFKLQFLSRSPRSAVSVPRPPDPSETRGRSFFILQARHRSSLSSLSSRGPPRSFPTRKVRFHAQTATSSSLQVSGVERRRKVASCCRNNSHCGGGQEGGRRRP